MHCFSVLQSEHSGHCQLCYFSLYYTKYQTLCTKVFIDSNDHYQQPESSCWINNHFNINQDRNNFLLSSWYFNKTISFFGKSIWIKMGVSSISEETCNKSLLNNIYYTAFYTWNNLNDINKNKKLFCSLISNNIVGNLYANM